MRTARPVGPHARLRARLRWWALAWLLVVGATGALGAAKTLAAARAHACCPPGAARADATPAPCPALLPLACCDATTLPAATPDAPPRPLLALALPAAADPLAAPAPAAVHRIDAGPAPPTSPLSLSVVLRL